MTRRVLKVASIAAVLLAAGAAIAASSGAQAPHTMKIDATGLTSKAFFLENQWYEGTGVESVELAAGTYFLAPGSGYVMRCALVVTDAGTWTYASECDGFLSGRDTDTLRLIGFTVTVDASPLSTPITIANLSGDTFGATARPVTLLPTFADYIVSPGPGVIAGCHFGVTLEGTITYPDEMHGCLGGRGSRTVTFNGFPISIDARELSTAEFSILQANGLQHQPSDVVQRYRLLPTLSGYHYGAWTVSGILWPSLGLTVGLDGRIGYPASADGWVSGRATDTLVIHGYAIQIDARAVAPGAFAVPDGGTGWLDRAAVHSLRLAPTNYLYFTSEPTDFRFSIRESDGAIDVDRNAAPCAFGSGATLIVGCQKLSVEDLTVDEPAPGTGARRVVRVRLSAPAPADVTVDYATSDGSATAPDDYAAATGTITFPAGTTGRPINVTINGDTAPEPSEQFTVTLSNPRNATIDRAAATVTIQDAAAPDTRITAGPASGSTVNDPPRFEFEAITPNPWYFECEARWEGTGSTGFRRCASPHVVTPPSASAAGRLLLFQVRAVNFDGIPDPTPDMRAGIAYQPPRIDLSLIGIEVTQGVQHRDCRIGRCTAGIMAPDPVARAVGRNPPAQYDGVLLSEARQTVARVYVQARGDRAFASGVTVRLTGRDSNGRPLASGGGVLLPRYQPAVPPPCCADLTFADRGNLQYAYTFPLPPDWSRHRTIGLRAEVAPRAGVTDTRPVDNSLEVTGIAFKRPTTVRLRPVAMSIGGTWPGAYDSAFVGAQATFPTAFEIPPYQGVVDATDVARAGGRDRQAIMGLSLIDDWADDMDYRSGVYPFGLFQPGLGLDTGATLTGTALYQDRTVSFARWGARALTSAAHELGHGLGLRHAGMKCGSNDAGQVGSEWPPENEGRTQGFGLDTRGGMFRIRPDTDASPSWDLMSYCPVNGGSNDDLHWLSPRNWTHLIDYFAPQFALPARAGVPPAGASATAASATAARQGATPALSVTASLDASGAASILSVRPITAARTPSVAASPWRIVVRDAAGRALSDTGVAPARLHDSAIQVLKARVPATGATTVQVVKDGVVLAERRRSAHAPRVRILSPRRGARVRGRTATVRWRASDADHDRLTVSLDYSGDGGRSWRTLFMGPDRGRVALPARLLTGSRNARLRLRARDGFNETATTSGRFTSAGAPPVVAISTPSKASTIRADATLVATGSAFDDGNRRLTGRRLTWRLGRRVIGRGSEISATDLPAGRHRLRLNARDRRGRTAGSSVPLRVLAVPPQFIELSAPAAIRSTARRVRVRVLTNITATMRLGGRRFRVGRRPRTIGIRVAPGRRPLRLRATLAAGGRRTAATLTVTRRG